MNRFERTTYYLRIYCMYVRTYSHSYVLTSTCSTEQLSKTGYVTQPTYVRGGEYHSFVWLYTRSKCQGHVSCDDFWCFALLLHWSPASEIDDKTMGMSCGRVYHVVQKYTYTGTHPVETVTALLLQYCYYCVVVAYIVTN